MCLSVRLMALGLLSLAQVWLQSGTVVAQNEVVREVLKNGVTILVQENHSMPVVTIRIYIRAGSIHEGEFLGSGISHFVEHTISKGTKTRSEQEIDRAVEEMGNASNAYTTLDHTCYYITTASQYFGRALDVLSDYVINPTFPVEQVEKEKGVILREIIMGEDDPGRVLGKALYRARYLRHPARHPVIGYRDELERLTREDLVTYHKRLYVPDNIVAVVAGDVKAEEAKEKLEKAFGEMQQRAAPQMALEAEPPVMGPRREIVEKPVNATYLAVGFPGVSLSDPDLYPLDTLAIILGRGTSSRLYRRLRETEQLVDGITAYSVTPAYGPGYLEILATLPPKNQDAAERVVREELEKIKEGGATEEEIAKAKRILVSDHVFMQETIEGQAAQIGTDQLLAGDPDFSRRYIERIDRVTAQDVQRVAREYLNADKLCLAAVRPPTAGETITVEKPAERETKRFVMDNGMVVLLHENHATPTVSVVAAFPGGVRFETEANNGISNLTANLLVKGTKQRSAVEIAEFVDSLGARLSPVSGRNSIGCSLEVLAQDFEAGLGLLKEVLFEPTFPEDEVEKEKRLTLTAMEQRKDSPFFIAGRLLSENYFTHHPYRLDPMGSESSVPALTREAIVRFHETHCVPNDMALAIFGDLDPVRAQEEVEHIFGRLPAGNPEQASPPPQEPPPSTREILGQKPGIEQTVIFMGMPGSRLDDEDIYVLDVLDAVLSGASVPGGRLHNRLRGERLVYVVHAYNSPGIEPGMFLIYAATEPGLEEKVRTAIREEIERLRSAEVPGEELERGKRMCISSFEIARQSNMSQAQTVAYDELYGLGYDRYLHYPERIEEVTASQVLEAARKHLDLEHTIIAAVRPSASK